MYYKIKQFKFKLMKVFIKFILISIKNEYDFCILIYCKL